MSSETDVLRSLTEQPGDLVFAEVLGFGDVYDVSHAPTDVETATVSDVLVNDGESIAVAEATAADDTGDEFPTNLFTSTETSGIIAAGSATVVAESDAQVIASSFINGGETFSFNFDLFFDLYSTEIEYPGQAYTNAEITNGFYIYEISDVTEPELVGYFQVESTLISSEMIGDATINYEIIEEQASVEFFDEADVDVNNDNEIDLISGFVLGTYEHEFDTDSHVTVVHFNNNAVEILKDMLIGSLGEAVTYGTLFDDTLEADGEVYGSLGNDEIVGGDGDDILRGGAGNDRLDGGAGNDQLIGGLGEDAIVSALDGKPDTVTGSESAMPSIEVDSAIYHGVRAGFEITEVDGGHQVKDIDSSDGDEGTDHLIDVELAVFDDGFVPVQGLIPVRISFKGEGAKFANAFGVYDMSTMKAELLVPDLNDTAEGVVVYEADLTQEQLDNLGFFLLPDGGDQNPDLASLLGEELMVVNTVDGYTVSADGTPLSGVGAPAFFSDASLNPGGLDHFVEDEIPAAYGLSVEDLKGGGDLDFDDAMFLMEVGVPLTATNVKVTFESESAAFHNTFGYFIEGTDKAGIIFADLDETTLPPGTIETFDLMAEDYKKLKFFLIPDGATKNADLFSDLDAIDLIIEDTGIGLQARDEASGTVLEGFVNPVYVPEKTGNPDATRHALQIGDVDDFDLSWEDQPSGGDNDYNDTVISVEITPLGDFV